ncbi:hypothetical protein WA171_002701 [Blastocystis sp. BT1]
MSLKILKQQLKDLTQEDDAVFSKPVSTKHRTRSEDKFTRQRKVMKKNTKPKGHDILIEDTVSMVKEEVQNARDRKERNKEWNMKVIEAMSKVDGTEVMNRYLVKKGLRSEEKKESLSKKTSVNSYRIKAKATKDSKPSSFVWE